jgi:oligopeptide transport system substrate-binding protein
MKHLKRFIALILSITMLFILTGCDETDEAYIYFNLNEQPFSLDPQTAQSDTELMIIRNIFEGLMRKDENGKIVCGVAKDYKKNGFTYTFYLRDNAIWSNEEKVTAYDFLFAFKRALNPETKSIFANRLISIKNAKEILNGKKNVNDLGVKVIDAHTLRIELVKDDPYFLDTLTTNVAMPCNEEFFNNAAGRYGLESETTLSNGSYRLTKWGKTVFGIRLYRNKYYKGNFVAKNAAVFLSIDNERTSIEVLKAADADMAFIDPLNIPEAEQNNLGIARYNNVCWFLTVGNKFSNNIRKSLLTLANPKVFSDDLIDGYYPAKNIFPSILSVGNVTNGMPKYNLQEAKKTFKSEVQKLPDREFPENIILYYYDDGFSKNVVTDIAAHWQNQLGAFINIESVSTPKKLQSQITEQTYDLAVFPIYTASSQVHEYLEKLEINYNGNLGKAQESFLKSNNIIPLMTQDTIMAYNKNLENFGFSSGNGLIDFAYIVKHEE